MPIYEYRCRGCGAAFERRLSFDDRLRTQRCPECGATESALLMSVPARPAAANPPAFDSPACPSTGEACGCGPASLN